MSESIPKKSRNIVYTGEIFEELVELGNRYGLFPPKELNIINWDVLRAETIKLIDNNLSHEIHPGYTAMQIMEIFFPSIAAYMRRGGSWELDIAITNILKDHGYPREYDNK